MASGWVLWVRVGLWRIGLHLVRSRITIGGRSFGPSGGFRFSSRRFCSFALLIITIQEGSYYDRNYYRIHVSEIVYDCMDNGYEWVGDFRDRIF